MAQDSMGNDVHADEKLFIFGRFCRKKGIIPVLNLQNSGRVPIRFFGTTCRSFSERSASRDALAAVFQIRRWFYVEES